MNPASRKTIAASVSVASNTALIIMKIGVGLLIGSVSVISEAIHSGLDLLAALIALLAVRKGSKPADKEHPFGHGKIENISGTVEALLIFAAAVWILYEAIHKLIRPTGIDAPSWGVLVMALSAGTNLLVSRYLFKVGRETSSAALEADGWHLRTDVWTSVGVMVALGLIWGGDQLILALQLPEQRQNEWMDRLHIIDPIAAILVAVLIMRTAWTLTVRSAGDLVDVTLPADEEAWIDNVLREYPAVHGFHRMRTRRAGPQRFVEFHVFVEASMTVRQSHDLSHRLAKIIQDHFGQTHVTVHVEPCIGNCERPEAHAEERKA